MQTRQARLAEALEARRLLSTYALDPTFGTGGTTELDPEGIQQISDVQQLSDGTYTLISSKPEIEIPSGETLYYHHFETRLLADGTPVLSFGVEGSKDIGELGIRRAGS